MVIWYLIERACFSAISAWSRSPTIFWGSWARFTATLMISSKALFMPKSFSSPMVARICWRSIIRLS